MHVLYGLKTQQFNFELKGGTSLSKGHKIINRFSEDIDIHVQPPQEMNVNENPRNTKDKAVEGRRNYYDWLADTIKIDGIETIERDHLFDNKYFTSGGVRLHYKSLTDPVEGVKEGILLEAGFDTVTPFTRVPISSWALDRAMATAALKGQIHDNNAADIPCYDPGYTFVEKLQTIARMFRQEQTGTPARPNLMRQYYDVYCLLDHPSVQAFIGTPEYKAHKSDRFSAQDLEIPLHDNPAYSLNDSETRTVFRKRYEATKSLYYKGQPDFDLILERIGHYIGSC